jgi:hypothetical protein
MEKDKEILFSEVAQIKFAEMIAKCLMPDTRILEQLSMPSSNIEVDSENFTYTIKKPENEQQENEK